MPSKAELAAIKAEINNLAAETFALQAVIVQLANRLGALTPEHAKAVLQSFDDAANFVEHFSITKGRASAHIPRVPQDH